MINKFERVILFPGTFNSENVFLIIILINLMFNNFCLHYKRSLYWITKPFIRYWNLEEEINNFLSSDFIILTLCKKKNTKNTSPLPLCFNNCLVRTSLLAQW